MNTAALKLYIRISNALSADRGATGIEYALMVALIAAVLIVTVGFLGHRMADRLGGAWLGGWGTGPGN
jgi:Flp pilus assembly pilin Flp